MAGILEKLAAGAEARVAAAVKKTPLTALKDLIGAGAAPAREPFIFEKTLQKPGLSFLCEVKRASPSKGVIAENFSHLAIARAYEDAGADCISCLTEPSGFLGSDEIFRDIRGTVRLPMLRKDFTISAYQLYEARLLGADAVLLICALLPDHQLAEYLAICETLGISALVETRSAEELHRAADAGARIVGVNNRSLDDFSVDTSVAPALRSYAPKNALFVAESGIRTPADVMALRECGADAVLIGEALMCAEDKGAALARLRGSP